MANWTLLNRKGEFEAIRKEFSLDPVTVRLICNRRLNNIDAVRKFLYPTKDQLYSPFLMKGMERACTILKDSIAFREAIRIIGDYDVDGVFSTYILYDMLHRMGAIVDYRIPERVQDGYGVNERIVREAATDGVRVLLTCDNGISAADQIALAYQLGMKVIVTDHHDVPEVLPQAEALLNPKLGDSTYPFHELCGAGVALKLAQAMGLDCSQYLAYAAIATVCDIVPLTDENRCIVKLGMEELKQCTNPGLIALAQVNQLSLETIDTSDIGYRLGPCINAGGRLARAETGVKLLLSNSMQEALPLATALFELNEERKKKTQEAVEEAEKVIRETNALQNTVLVLQLKDCHESVAGIVAGRIREAYNRPTLILTYGSDCVKGSARSVEEYSIIDELRACEDLLLHYGGHPMAAGLSMEAGKVDSLRERLNQRSNLTASMLEAKFTIDLELPFLYVNEERIEEIKLLRPHGPGNPRPLFAIRDVDAIGAVKLGREKKFMKFTLREESGMQLDALCFLDAESVERDIIATYGEQQLAYLYERKPNKVRLSVVYDMEINEYREIRTPQLMMRDYKLLQ